MIRANRFARIALRITRATKGGAFPVENGRAGSIPQEEVLEGPRGPGGCLAEIPSKVLLCVWHALPPPPYLVLILLLSAPTRPKTKGHKRISPRKSPSTGPASLELREKHCLETTLFTIALVLPPRMVNTEQRSPPKMFVREMS